MGNLVLLSDTMPELLPQVHRDLTIPHVSEILRIIGIRNGTLPDYSNSSPPKNKMELGNIFENGRKYMYHQAFPGRFITPGEIVFDGIGLNIDMLDTWDDGPVHEFKCSWFSANKQMDDPSLVVFRDQVKCYQFVANELDLSSCLSPQLEIVYPRGNYKTNDCEYRHWREDCTQDELEKLWNMIVRHKHLWRPKG